MSGAKKLPTQNDDDLFRTALPSGTALPEEDGQDTGIPASGPRGPVSRWKASDQDHTQSHNKKP